MREDADVSLFVVCSSWFCVAHRATGGLPDKGLSISGYSVPASSFVPASTTVTGLSRKVGLVSSAATPKRKRVAADAFEVIPVFNVVVACVALLMRFSGISSACPNAG